MPDRGGGEMYAWLIGKLIRLGYRQAIAGRPRLVTLLAASDVTFTFPGDNSFAGQHRGKLELAAWLRRFASLVPEFTIHDVLVSGPIWDLRIALRFSDAIGDDYRNEGMEYLRVRRGKVQEIEVFLNTETIHAWESRHPELVA